MRSVARYPEVRDDGSMWVPLAPPPAPVYQQLSRVTSDVVGMRAVLVYSTEWVMDLRIFSAPYEERTDKTRWVVQLCDEGAWYDYRRHGREPEEHERLISSLRLVFMLHHPGPR